MKFRAGVAVTLVCLYHVSCGPKAIQKQPVPQEDVIRAYRLMAEGDELLRQGKDHLALLKYLEASQHNPYHEVIFNKLAVTYSRLQMYDQAERAVDRSIGLNRSYAYAYNTRGIIDMAKDDFKGAVKSLEKAIDLRPDVANFYVNLGYAYMQRDQYEKAVDSYRRALQMDPLVFEDRNFIELGYSGPDALNAERFYEMSRLFAELGNKEFCLSYLTKALGAGFSDFRRLVQDDAFHPLREDPDFLSLLNLYGVK